MQETRLEKRTRLRENALQKLATRTTAELVTYFEIVKKMIDETDDWEKRLELWPAFSWICEALEIRDPSAMEAFDNSDDESPRAYFLA